MQEVIKEEDQLGEASREMFSRLQEFSEEEEVIFVGRQRSRATIIVKRPKEEKESLLPEEYFVINDPSTIKEIDKVANYHKILEISEFYRQLHQAKLVEFGMVKKKKSSKKLKKPDPNRRKMGFSLSNTDYMRTESFQERHTMTVGDVSSVASFLQDEKRKTKDEDFSAARNLIQREANPSIDSISFSTSMML